MDVFQDPAQDQENQHVVKAAKNVIPTKRIAGKEVVATKRAALGGKTNVSSLYVFLTSESMNRI